MISLRRFYQKRSLDSCKVNDESIGHLEPGAEHAILLSRLNPWQQKSIDYRVVETSEFKRSIQFFGSSGVIIANEATVSALYSSLPGTPQCVVSPEGVLPKVTWPRRVFNFGIDSGDNTLDSAVSQWIRTVSLARKWGDSSAAGSSC